MSEDAIRVFCRVKPSPNISTEEQQKKTRPQNTVQQPAAPTARTNNNNNRTTAAQKPTAAKPVASTAVPQAQKPVRKAPRKLENDEDKFIDDDDIFTPRRATKRVTKKVEDQAGAKIEEAVKSPRGVAKPKPNQAAAKPAPAAGKPPTTKQNGQVANGNPPEYTSKNQKVKISGFEERRPIQGKTKQTINQPGHRPVYEKNDAEYEVEYGRSGRDSIYIYAPDGYIVPNNNNLNASSEYQFTFSGVFDQGAAQTEVYDAVARPIVDSALTGYNGTVFAYGQTSTGKTYTIFGPDASLYGGKGRFNHRNQSQIESDVTMEDGLVARTLAHIFSSGTPNMRVEVSYLEIYKEIGYDLFAGVRGVRKKIHHFSELPRVTALTTARGNLYLRNLSVFEVETREEAMELLMLGNANRQVAETHLNKASSRSHCVFTVYLTIDVPDLRKTLRSKVNLVDLAGSERVGKSHMQNGQLLSEAKNINLSLHHLQQVIVSLSARDRHDVNGRRRHVPYRNSMLTMVLSDSLGGNSLTAMVATVSPELDHLDESISTCRFAQRVSKIRNKPKVNEVVESEVVIAQLRQELDKLKGEYGSMGNLQPDEEEYLMQLMQTYITNQDKEVLEVGRDMDKVQFCFNKMREIILASQAKDAQKNKKSSTCSVM